MIDGRMVDAIMDAVPSETQTNRNCNANQLQAHQSLSQKEEFFAEFFRRYRSLLLNFRCIKLIYLKSISKNSLYILQIKVKVKFLLISRGKMLNLEKTRQSSEAAAVNISIWSNSLFTTVIFRPSQMQRATANSPRTIYTHKQAKAIQSKLVLGSKVRTKNQGSKNPSI